MAGLINKEWFEAAVAPHGFHRGLEGLESRIPIPEDWHYVGGGVVRLPDGKHFVPRHPPVFGRRVDGAFVGYVYVGAKPHITETGVVAALVFMTDTRGAEVEVRRIEIGEYPEKIVWIGEDVRRRLGIWPPYWTTHTPTSRDHVPGKVPVLMGDVKASPRVAEALRELKHAERRLAEARRRLGELEESMVVEEGGIGELRDLVAELEALTRDDS